MSLESTEAMSDHDREGRGPIFPAATAVRADLEVREIMSLVLTKVKAMNDLDREGRGPVNFWNHIFFIFFSSFFFH